MTPESEIAALVRAVVPDRRLDRDEIAERHARARWSALVEPGDADAGRLIAAVGAIRALELVETGPDAGLLATVADGSFADAVERWRPRVRQVDTALHLRQAARFGARLVIPGDPEWPTGLDDLGVHSPAALWVRGDPAVLGGLARSIAIVGARAATGYGEHVTIEVASGLVDRGFAIVSGAAFGIDGAAHRAALASGGATVAFLAGGVDRFYPSAHETLLTRIVERGAVVAEVPCGTAPTKWRFLQRKLVTYVLTSGKLIGGHLAGAGGRSPIRRGALFLLLLASVSAPALWNLCKSPRTSPHSVDDTPRRIFLRTPIA